MLRGLFYPTFLRTIKLLHGTSQLVQRKKICLFQLSRLVHQSPDDWSSRPLGIKNEALTEKQQDTPKDLLMDQLRRSLDLSTVMQLTSQHCKIMNNEHMSLSFELIFKFLRSESLLWTEWANSAAFRNLCNQALKKIRFFSSDEVLSIFKTLVFLKVPHDTALSQATLQMLRHSVNDLNIYQINFLEFLLRQVKSRDPLVDSIRMALPLILKTQLEYQLEASDIKLLVDSCASALRYSFKPSDFQKVIQLLLERKDDLTKEQIFRLFYLMARYPRYKINENPELLQFKEELISLLCSFVPSLKQHETKPIMGTIQNNRDMWSSKLFTHLSHKAVTENWNLIDLTDLVKCFVINGFVSIEVLDLIAQKMKHQPDLVIEDPSISVLSLVEAFSCANYVPCASNEFLEVILLCTKKLNELEEKAPYLLVKLVTCLAMLEAATPELISRVMDRQFMSFLVTHPNPLVVKNSLQNYRLLDQVSRIEMKDSYIGPFMPEEMLARTVKDRSNVIKPVDMNLKEFLEIGLGGPQFVLSNLWTQYGHYVDHLIVMRKGDFPVSAASQKKTLQCSERQDGLCYVEDVVVPPESKMVAIMIARQEWFTNDPPRLSGWTSLQHRTLTKLGYNPVILGPPYVMEDRSQDLIGLLDNETY